MSHKVQDNYFHVSENTKVFFRILLRYHHVSTIVICDITVAAMYNYLRSNISICNQQLLCYKTNMNKHQCRVPNGAYKNNENNSFDKFCYQKNDKKMIYKRCISTLQSYRLN